MSIYYYPEKFGLTTVSQIDFGAEYEYDMIVVWATKDGELVWATDSGCSCPIPFENVTVSDLKPVTLATLTKTLEGKMTYGREYGRAVSPIRVADFIGKVIKWGKE